MLLFNLPFKALMFLSVMRPSLFLFMVLCLKVVQSLLKGRCRLALLPFLISCLIRLHFLARWLELVTAISKVPARLPLLTVLRRFFSCSGLVARHYRINEMMLMKNLPLHFLTWRVFIFPSRRRPTRLQGDWSSDVCSSDLFMAYVFRYCVLSLLMTQNGSLDTTGGNKNFVLRATGVRKGNCLT